LSAHPPAHPPGHILVVLSIRATRTDCEPSKVKMLPDPTQHNPHSHLWILIIGLSL